MLWQRIVDGVPLLKTDPPGDPRGDAAFYPRITCVSGWDSGHAAAGPSRGRSALFCRPPLCPHGGQGGIERRAANEILLPCPFVRAVRLSFPPRAEADDRYAEHARNGRGIGGKSPFVQPGRFSGEEFLPAFQGCPAQGMFRRNAPRGKKAVRRIMQARPGSLVAAVQAYLRPVAQRSDSGQVPDLVQREFRVFSGSETAVNGDSTAVGYGTSSRG